MRRKEVLAILRSRQSDLRDLGVERLDLFGSTARDKAEIGSDVDLLVRFRDRPTFLRYMALQLALQGWLGERVDLVTEGSLAMKPRAHAMIAAERLRVT